MQDAIIGVNEKPDILFMNDAARKTLNITDDKIIGKNAGQLVKSNDLFRSILKDEATIKPFKIVLDSRESFFQLQRSDIVLQLASQSAGRCISSKILLSLKNAIKLKPIL
jgi:NtrC-family two-component system sensor histidine kinase KinB